MYPGVVNSVGEDDIKLKMVLKVVLLARMVAVIRVVSARDVVGMIPVKYPKMAWCGIDEKLVRWYR